MQPGFRVRMADGSELTTGRLLVVRGRSADDVVLFEHTYRLADTERGELVARGIRSLPDRLRSPRPTPDEMRPELDR